ncbi:cryptochrome/photolyase family protein [Pseudooctadecabacter jejudonensis]|uniref:Deoxyribodipyrimidine photo-lyase-related protein n=1 Tax=Pseudooctadecabacter jejudonensis TaxID=1391910 RepID=A0A1Y5SS16_9RHOB|nr:cryptochrome/photolyase family protein [Pseudooctadecabacter jejudonensis]SLN46918.1 Deoxyribodipyrimidine photo-lyase-related protein [Pseudooctadecabacter jejudonensis]
MVKLVLVLGDQLSDDLSALANANKEEDVVVMAEVMGEASYVRHHPKKIAFLFAAMRKFADRLRESGWDVRYSKLEDDDTPDSLNAVLLQRAEEVGATTVLTTEAGEWRVIEALEELPLEVETLADDRFIATHAEFENWAEGRKALRMEYFYREMRRKTGLMMEGDQPAGGKWNFDHDNRKSAPKDIDYSGPMRFQTDETTREVIDVVRARFASHFGTLDDFWFATDQGQARQHLAHWVKGGLPKFGDFQDAMMGDERFLYHAIVGLYINAGLLNPLEVCRAVEDAWKAGDAPINAAEGFIRQIIGWREYIRGIYFLEGPEYTSRNALGHHLDLPAFFWGEKTWMRCVEKAVEQTREEAYAHHIQRLMVTGNFALLAGVDPRQVHEWYLAVYADAYEWVEAPNVIGMSQFADGGIIASKPYISSGNYIDKMSDYCKECSYKVKDKTGPDACPFNLLYWHFLDRHRDRFKDNHRMGNMYRVWDRMDEDKRTTVLREADAFLAKLNAGETV